MAAHVTEELVQTAGINPVLDSYRRGAIAAYRDFLNIEMEESSQ